MTSEPAATLAPAAPQNGADQRQPPTQRDGTEYVILERVEAKDGEGAAWRPTTQARTGGGAEAAIKQAVGDREGAFKAVPFRSWKGGLTLGQETRKVTVAKSLED